MTILQVNWITGDVDAFEALVQAQTPAVTPWTPVTDYSFEARKDIEGQHPQLIKDVFQPKAVLDVGCGPGHLIEMLRALGVQTCGVDKVESPNPHTVELDIARPLNRVLREDGTHNDLVLCREVLEHLTVREIAVAVRNLCRLTTRYVYVTTRFHPDPQSLLDVATSDDLDPTHQTMLNKDFLRVLFILEGFTRRADLEEKMDWQQKGRVLVYERA